MIDPTNPPHVATATTAELEEFLLFGIFVAGQRASTAAAGLASLLASLPEASEAGDSNTPFGKIKHLARRNNFWTESGVYLSYPTVDVLAGLLRSNGARFYKVKARGFYEAAHSNINVRHVSRQKLMSITGIGLKTANFYVSYTGINPNCVTLDVHILNQMRDWGYQVPSQTPSTWNRYNEIAGWFADEASKRDMSVLDLDKKIWKEKSGTWNSHKEI